MDNVSLFYIMHIHLTQMERLIELTPFYGTSKSHQVNTRSEN